MIVKTLSISNFRNLENVQLEFSDRLNIIIGDNGQGKTNILESIYLLSEGESFRYSKNENLIRLGQSVGRIYAAGVSNDLNYKFSLNISAQKKELRVNEKATSFKKTGRFATVLFSPESLSIIKEAADQRRQFVDQFVEQMLPSGLEKIRDYRKILKVRNKLLKDIADEKIPLTQGKDILESLNPSFLKLAIEVSYLRISILTEMRPFVENALKKITSDSTTELGFRYIVSDYDHSMSDLQKLSDFLKKRLQELAIPELKSGVSLVGPHKHDIVFLYSGNDSRFYCSQGQQRSVILAYKLAQIVYYQRVNGFYPLLLLDDVLSELDLTKQESLISTLNQTEAQTFVTTTDVSLLSKLSMSEAKVFKVRGGQISI